MKGAGSRWTATLLFLLLFLQRPLLVDANVTDSAAGAAETEGGTGAAEEEEEPVDCGLDPHDYLEVKFILISVMGTLVGLFGIFGNVSTALILTRPSMRNPNNLFLTALAIFDTSILFAAFAIYAMEYIIEYTRSLDLYLAWLTYLRFAYAVSHISQTGSVYVTVAVTVERYMAVCWPRHAKTLCTSRSSVFTIMGVVAFAIIFNATKFFELEVVRNEACGELPNGQMQWQRYQIQPSSLASNPLYGQVYGLWLSNVMMVFLPFITLLVLNSIIAYTIQKSLRSINLNAEEFPGANQLKKKSREATNVLVVIVFIFLICNFWGFLLTLLEQFVDSEWLRKDHHMFYTFFREAINFIAIVNASINFVIYCYFGREFRRELLVIYGCGLGGFSFAIPTHDKFAFLRKLPRLKKERQSTGMEMRSHGNDDPEDGLAHRQNTVANDAKDNAALLDGGASPKRRRKKRRTKQKSGAKANSNESPGQEPIDEVIEYPMAIQYAVLEYLKIQVVESTQIARSPNANGGAPGSNSATAPNGRQPVRRARSRRVAANDKSLGTPPKRVDSSNALSPQSAGKPPPNGVLPALFGGRQFGRENSPATAQSSNSELPSSVAAIREASNFLESACSALTIMQIPALQQLGEESSTSTGAQDRDNRPTIDDSSQLVHAEVSEVVEDEEALDWEEDEPLDDESAFAGPRPNLCMPLPVVATSELCSPATSTPAMATQAVMHNAAFLLPAAAVTAGSPQVGRLDRRRARRERDMQKCEAIPLPSAGGGLVLASETPRPQICLPIGTGTLSSATPIKCTAIALPIPPSPQSSSSNTGGLQRCEAIPLPIPTTSTDSPPAATLQRCDPLPAAAPPAPQRCEVLSLPVAASTPSGPSPLRCEPIVVVQPAVAGPVRCEAVLLPMPDTTTETESSASGVAAENTARSTPPSESSTSESQFKSNTAHL